MIPVNISAESILKSLAHIDQNGIPKDRHSVKWSLKHKGQFYPPKYVISIANMYENGEEWAAEKFSGGPETNQFLENLGFEIVGLQSQPIEYPLESHSWKAISDTVAIKVLDKSAFLHYGSGVPRDFKLIFGLDKLTYGQQVNITLIHKDTGFDAHFQMDKPLERMRLFWRSDFSDLLKKYFPDWYQIFSKDIEFESERPEMRFLKLSDSEYQIDFIHPTDILFDIESEIAEETITRSEGAARYSYSKRYERDPVSRRKAIEIHGCVCLICGFDFELTYGERGKGFIEIHHTKPLSEVDGEADIDPRTDLFPVCSNCHRMLHRRKNDVLSISEMKVLLLRSKNQS